jgi:putative ABC transport system substrate-binding protein
LLRTTTAAPFAPIVVELRKGLSEEGFIEGHNVALEQRWADNQLDRLPGLAADLVRRKAAVIVVNTPAVVAVARAAGPTVPLVFVAGDDPVKMGLVSSLNRPEGNLTGVTFFGGSVLGAKRLELLHELVPKVSLVAILLDPDSAVSGFDMPSIETAARVLGLQIVVVKPASEHDFDAAFARIVTTGAGAVLFGGGPVLRTQVQQLIALAARHAIPVIYELRDYVEAGGLISYGASFPGAYRQAGVYAGRILKGAKPAELPVLQPTRFELVINLKTAKLLALADEVIE